jgi:hypothetical protein
MHWVICGGLPRACLSSSLILVSRSHLHGRPNLVHCSKEIEEARRGIEKRVLDLILHSYYCRECYIIPESDTYMHQHHPNTMSSAFDPCSDILIVIGIKRDFLATRMIKTLV